MKLHFTAMVHKPRVDHEKRQFLKCWRFSKVNVDASSLNPFSSQAFDSDFRWNHLEVVFVFFVQYLVCFLMPYLVSKRSSRLEFLYKRFAQASIFDAVGFFLKPFLVGQLLFNRNISIWSCLKSVNSWSTLLFTIFIFSTVLFVTVDSSVRSLTAWIFDVWWEVVKIYRWLS